MLRGIQELAENFMTLNGGRADLITDKQRLEAEKDSFASRLADRDKDHQTIG
jgi:hypothetical protein